MKRTAFLPVCALFLLATMAAAQRTITVGPGGGYDYLTIQNGIDAATTGDTVIVYPATYFENVYFKGKSIILQSTNPTSASIVATTIIDANSFGSVVTFIGTENSSCVLCGFTIRNAGFLYYGGLPLPSHGIEGRGTLARIENNVVANNDSEMTGGGIYDCDGLIQNNKISDNSSDSGGGLCNCDGIIESNIISDNVVASSGNGGGLAYCQGLIRGNTITGNSGGSGGGGLYYCTAVIENNVVSSNRSDRITDGTGLSNCYGTIRNNMIAGNTGDGLSVCIGTIQNNTVIANSIPYGYGLYGCHGTIVNCIVRGNGRMGGSWPQVVYCSDPTYCCIQEWTGGGLGNITTDPLFTTGPLGPYYLSQIAAGQAVQSPCVDAGSSTAAQLGLADRTTRTDGQPDAGIVDMGYHYPTEAVPLATISTNPTSFSVAAQYGQTTVIRTLSVWNSGEGSTFDYALATSPTWLLGVYPAEGHWSGVQITHFVELKTPQLFPGHYGGSIVISGNASNSPVTIPVDVTVQAVGGPPNLTLSNVNIGPVAPVQVHPGDPIVLSASVDNTGTADAGPFWTEVWGSRTGGLTLDRFLATSLRLPDGLLGTDSYSWATSAPLYSIPDGPYTVVYAVDRPGEVAETNERDNRAVVRAKRLLVIRPQTQIDLAVEGFAMSLNPAQSGQDVAFAGRVVNRGSQASGPFWIEFWGSWDWPYPNLNFFLCDSIFVENLDPGASIALAFYPRRLYADVPAGIFMVGCVADRDDAINELDETNNYQFEADQVIGQPALVRRQSNAPAGAADIVVAAADFSPAAPARSAPGDTVTLTLELTNPGSANTGPFWVEFWGSRDGGLTLGDFLADSNRLANLAPGQTARLTVAKHLYGVPDGPYSVVVVADRPGEVAEADESNNRRVIAGKRLLVIRPPTEANLTVENFRLRNPISSLFMPDGTVRNGGASDSGPFWIEFWACPDDPDYPWLDRFVCDSVHIDNLSPGEGLELYSFDRAAYLMPTGVCAIICILDRLDQVAETDETDNYAIVRGVTVLPH